MTNETDTIIRSIQDNVTQDLAPGSAASMPTKKGTPRQGTAKPFETQRAVAKALIDHAAFDAQTAVSVKVLANMVPKSTNPHAGRRNDAHEERVRKALDHLATKGRVTKVGGKRDGGVRYFGDQQALQRIAG
jgi:hypothetical protein